MNKVALTKLLQRLYQTEQISFNDARALLAAVDVAGAKWDENDTRKHGEIVHAAIQQMNETGD